MGQPTEESRVEEPRLGNFRCYFCESNPILFFQERFIFCPECAALYTFHNVKSWCDHVNGRIPELIRHPWINKDTPKVFLYRIREWLFCSECDAETEVLE